MDSTETAAWHFRGQLFRRLCWSIRENHVCHINVCEDSIRLGGLKHEQKITACRDPVFPTVSEYSLSLLLEHVELSICRPWCDGFQKRR